MGKTTALREGGGDVNGREISTPARRSWIAELRRDNGGGDDADESIPEDYAGIILTPILPVPVRGGRLPKEPITNSGP